MPSENEKAVDEYMQDYPDVSRAEAKRRLSLQGQVDDLREKLIDRLADGFAEVYFDNTDGMHVVAISSRGSRERAEQAMAELGLQTRVVQRSQDHRQLKASIDALNRKLRGRIERGLVTVGLTAEGIEVLIAGSASADERADVRAAVKDTPDATVVQTSRPTLKTEPAATCNSTYRYCNELIGGIRYWTANVGCTAGFYAGPAGVYDPKMMTAGHCITSGGGVSWYSCKASGSPCLDAGWEANHAYGGSSGDNGIMNFTQPGNWSIVAGVFDWANLVHRGITAVGNPRLGYQLCHYGSTTGASCGTVDDTNATVTLAKKGMYPETTLYGMSRVANICVQGGDSGGPAMMSGGHWAAGIVSGGGCDFPGYVEPIERVQNNYGIFVYG
jgi:ribosome-associated translation inhibitor RaiA